ncbi:MAG: hypothetical protein K940chlam3_00877 [Chlamydiae bacterium]|nr:hypothetical protein [Chlamydiota bacterium]
MNNDCQCTFKLTSRRLYGCATRDSTEYALPCETAVKFLKGLEPYVMPQYGPPHKVQNMKMERSGFEYAAERETTPWLAAEQIQLFVECGTCLPGAVKTKPEKKSAL